MTKTVYEAQYDTFSIPAHWNPVSKEASSEAFIECRRLAFIMLYYNSKS
jgi:hypothetical protein